MRPLWDYPPDQRAAGEGPRSSDLEPLDTDAAVTTFPRINAAMDDPAQALRALRGGLP
jgi:hypothetical protein